MSGEFELLAVLIRRGCFLAEWEVRVKSDLRPAVRRDETGSAYMIQVEVQNLSGGVDMSREKLRSAVDVVFLPVTAKNRRSL